MPDIVLDNVSKSFTKQTHAVENLSLTIPDGSFTTLLGPSGCGKTTTLRMIAGLDLPTAGEITIGGTVVFSEKSGAFVHPSKRNLGLVFQSYALWPHLTVKENIIFGLEINSVDKPEVRARLEKVATALRLDSLLDRYTNELSGGQQQRVAIARVLIMEPSVLLLDEPLSNLDATLRMEMRAELKRLHRETGATIIYVTHDQLEALTMSTHIALLSAGELQQFAAPLEIYEKPTNQFAADFLGSPRINFVRASLTSDSLVWGGLKIALPGPVNGNAPQEVLLGLRAEELRLDRVAQKDALVGRILTVLPTGADWFYQVEVAGQVLTIRHNDSVPFSYDDSVYVQPRPSSLKVFDDLGRAIL
jgi:ABC-type sugar transport system ATPase subunit